MASAVAENDAQDALADSRAHAHARGDQVAETLRGRLQELAPSRIEAVVEALDLALQAKKSAWGTCSSCNKQSRIEVNDSAAAVNAFKALLEATEGKPATAGEVSQSPVIVRRVGQARS